MTSFADEKEYVTATTILSCADLGYAPSISLADIAPIPLPAGIWLSLAAMGLLTGVARRRA